ncbi:MAG: NAD-dependent epimerase/dehydratase family protein [Deinococcales bacterium]
MRITVTGGAGFIGSHLVDRLLAGGHHVVVLDDFSTGHRSNLPIDHPRLRVLEGDAADPRAAAAATDGSKAVYHLAAVASVQASMEEPVRTHRANLIATLIMLEAASGAGAQRFVYASSAAVYGDARELPIREDAPKQPLSPYAADKLAGEHYLAHYLRTGRIGGVAFRFFNVFGPRQDPGSPYSGVISIFLDRARAGEPVTVFGDGEQTRDFVYVQDVVDQLVAALDAPLSDELASLNLGTGRAASLLELLAALRELLGPIEVRHGPERPGDIRHSLADVTRLHAWCRAVGAQPPSTPLREGLASMLEPVA